MSDQRPTEHRKPPSFFHGCPPSPNNAVQAMSARPIMSFGAPTQYPKSIPGFSRVLPPIDDSQAVSVSAKQRLENLPNPQRPLTMFSGIGQVHIGAGNFSQNIYNVNNRDHDILRHIAQFLPRSDDAAFNAAINFDGLARRPCTHGTRVNIIRQIMAWINEKDLKKAPPVYWLTGLAGMGKTTIAYTICERLNEAHLPFTSFFCSLQLDSRNSKLLVPTLCRDLAELYDSYAASVLSVLETNSKVVNAGLRIQIDELLVKPWQASVAQVKDIPTPIVVVEALDESDRGTEFLEELLRVIQAGQLAGMKFLVTSRPDPRIVDTCKSFPPNAICRLHEVDTANVQTDIEKYLREALPELKDERDFVLLSQRADGLFIYATTAVRFISPPHTRPSISEMRSHLQVMLKPSISHSQTHGRLLVDELYERILGDAFRDDRVRAKRLQILHTILCAEARVDISVLADITNTDQDTVRKVVESLHAVLFISSKDGCVYWYHASFPDFVFSEARARISIFLDQNYPTHPTQHIIDVFCNPAVYHGTLSRRCFSIMQESLHFNMCNLPSSYVFDSEVLGLNTSIDKTFSPTLRYVSRHWARHLVQASPATVDTDGLVYRLKEFLCKKLLFWIEVMNLIGAKSQCPSSLKDVELWAASNKEWPNLLAELKDAADFSAFFAGSPASKSTPHLYISALSMWNQDSAIWRNWRDRFALIPSISLPSATITIPLLTIYTGSRVNCIAFSPDGNRIVSGSDNKSVWVWDAKTGEWWKELQGHTGMVSSVAFSPDGNRIVSGSQDKSVRVWDVETGELLRVLKGHTGKVWSVAFSPDGNRIVSGSDDKLVRVWNAKTGEQLRMQHTAQVLSVTFSADGYRIASGSLDASVQVWNAQTGEQLSLLEHTGVVGSVGSVAFSPDGDRVISGSEDKSVRVWDANTGKQLRELKGHIDIVMSVAFSPDGNRIVSGSYDHSVRVWDARTGEQLKELQGHTGSVVSVAFSPDGNHIVSGSDDESIRVWVARTDEQSKKLQGYAEWVRSIAFLPDGNRIFSGTDDHSTRVWGIKTSKELRGLQGHTDAIWSVAFSPDGNQIVSGSHDKSVRVWDAKTGQQLRELKRHTDSAMSVAYSPDGNRVISGSRDRSVRVWDVQTGEQLRELKGHTDEVKFVAFSSNGHRIVSASWHTVWVWDAQTGEELTRLQGHSAVWSVAFWPDGNKIVSSHPRSVRVWDARTGEQLKGLQGDTHGVQSVAFSPDGNRIVSGSDDKLVRVWDAQTGEQLRVLQGHTGEVKSVSFSPDGNRIVSGSFDRTVRVWNAKTGEQLKLLQGHTDAIWSVAFSPDGNRIVSGSRDSSVRVWGNLNLDAPWVVKEDGWITRGGERLVWVPSTICNILLRQHDLLIISRNGSAKISLAQCKFGSRWNECYTPPTH